MQLNAIILARVLAFVETFDLNPQGATFYPELIRGIVEKFGFMRFPQKLEEMDETKGVEFAEGRWGELVVERFTIYQNGLLLDSRKSTDESKRVLLEGLAWAVSTFGLKFEPQMIRHYRYVSNLTFTSDVPLLMASSPIQRLVSDVQKLHHEITGIDTHWEAVDVRVHAEAVDQNQQFTPFSIQRRAQTAFSENKYFSEAPLPTDIHIACLEQFESNVASSLR